MFLTLALWPSFPHSIYFRTLACVHMCACVRAHVCVCSGAKSCPTFCDLVDCSLPGPSVHGISQASILEWVAMSFCREFPHPGIKPACPVSPALADGFLTTVPPGKSLRKRNIVNSFSVPWDIHLLASCQLYSPGLSFLRTGEPSLWNAIIWKDNALFPSVPGRAGPNYSQCKLANSEASSHWPPTP